MSWRSRFIILVQEQHKLEATVVLNCFELIVVWEAKHFSFHHSHGQLQKYHHPIYGVFVLAVQAALD